MKDKFSIELVWHNCQTCPPEENYNNNLYATNGSSVFRVIYDNGDWYDTDFDVFIPDDTLSKFWWADIAQTMNAAELFIGL